MTQPRIARCDIIGVLSMVALAVVLAAFPVGASKWIWFEEYPKDSCNGRPRDLVMQDRRCSEHEGSSLEFIDNIVNLYSNPNCTPRPAFAFDYVEASGCLPAQMNLVLLEHDVESGGIDVRDYAGVVNVKLKGSTCDFSNYFTYEMLRFGTCYGSRGGGSIRVDAQSTLTVNIVSFADDDCDQAQQTEIETRTLGDCIDGGTGLEWSVMFHAPTVAKDIGSFFQVAQTDIPFLQAVDPAPAPAPDDPTKNAGSVRAGGLGIAAYAIVVGLAVIAMASMGAQ